MLSWATAPPEDPRRALGLPNVDEYTTEQRATDMELGAGVLRVAADVFQCRRQGRTWPGRRRSWRTRRHLWLADWWPRDFGHIVIAVTNEGGNDA
jgi:hypothetical protein